MTRVLGIDPGLASCGWSIVHVTHNKPRCEASGVWTTDPHPDTVKRIAALGGLFANMLRGIELVSLEAWTYQGQRSFSTNTTTIPRVIQRMRDHAELRGVPCVEVPTQACKSSLGLSSRAQKRDVRRAVSILVDCDGRPPNVHAVDAIAAAIAGEREWRRMRATERTGT